LDFKMKRLIFVCLIMTCSVSYAEWEIYGIDEEFTSFFDKKTIRKNGVIVKIWELKNYIATQRDSDGVKYKSVKIYVANDCKSEMRAIASLVYYEGEFGEGAVTFSVSVQEKDWNWQDIVPGSIGASTWKIACGKK
jgi:hypothetical protein